MDMQTPMLEMGQRARTASRAVAAASAGAKVDALKAVADRLDADRATLRAANGTDVN